MRLYAAMLLAVTACLPFAEGQARDPKAVRQFKKVTPCPATGQIEKSCKGYVVDHVIALACGGADDPSNMQYQTIADAKEKDKWERKGCKNGRR